MLIYILWKRVFRSNIILKAVSTLNEINKYQSKFMRMKTSSVANFKVNKTALFENSIHSSLLFQNLKGY